MIQAQAGQLLPRPLCTAAHRSRKQGPCQDPHAPTAGGGPWTGGFIVNPPEQQTIADWCLTYNRVAVSAPPSEESGIGVCSTETSLAKIHRMGSNRGIMADKCDWTSNSQFSNLKVVKLRIWCVLKPQLVVRVIARNRGAGIFQGRGITGFSVRFSLSSSMITQARRRSAPSFPITRIGRTVARHDILTFRDGFALGP